MPKDPSTLPPGVRQTDTLTITQFATVFPVAAIVEVLEQCGCPTWRVRQLPNEYVVFFVMMLALFRECAHREVYRCVAEAFHRFAGNPVKKKVVIPTAAALSKARDRVKDLPFKILFHRFAVPLGQASQKGIFYRKWRKMAMDGSLFDVEDTPANRKFFGSASNQHGKVARNPQARLVTLMEVGTHAFVAGEIGTYHDGEVTLARPLLSHLKPDMICLADRNFYSFKLFRDVSANGSALLFRIQRGMSFTPDKQLSDDSFLIHIFDSNDRSKTNGLPARLIQYKVTGSSKEAIFLITNILDPEEAPADELARLYHERWEQENAFDELKTHLNANAIVLRSKKPDLVKQELWGMLMTHYVVRRTMYEAAIRAALDPDRISFTHTVNVIGRLLIRSVSVFSPSGTKEQIAEGDS